MSEPSTILVVEDNEAHAELIRRSLESQPVATRIEHVVDGDLALDYLYRRGAYADPESSPQPQVILLDLRMPKTDGLEVLKQLRTANGLVHIPVVILTTSKADRDVAMAYEHHASSYLVKPADFDEFTNLIGTVACYWLAWNYYPWS